MNGTASILLIDRSGRSVVVAFNRTGGDPDLVPRAEQLICLSADPGPDWVGHALEGNHRPCPQSPGDGGRTLISAGVLIWS